MVPKASSYIGDPESVAKRLYPSRRVSWWIRNWQPSYSMLPLQYPATPFLVTGALSSNYLIGRLLKHFSLHGKYTVFSVKLPSMAPLALLAMFHGWREVPAVANSFEDCPICFQMRAGAIQVFASVLHPLVLGTVCCGYTGLYVPRAYYCDWKGSFRHVWKHMRAKPSPYITMALINFVMAVAITETQQRLTLKVFDAVLEERHPRKRHPVPEQVEVND